jgi:hypothetical protein
VADRPGRERHRAPALQGPRRDEPRAALGNHHGPDPAPPAARADRRRHRSRPRLHHADGRRGGPTARIHRDKCAEDGEYRRLKLSNSQTGVRLPVMQRCTPPSITSQEPS